MPLLFQHSSNAIRERKIGKSKDGDSPEAWGNNKCRQKNVEAHWTKKHGKIHISIDRQYKVIRKHAITSAEAHDSQVSEELLDENNSSGSVWADSAYRSVGREAALPGAQTHRKSTRKRPLNKREQEAN